MTRPAWLPPGHSEERVLAEIEKVVGHLAPLYATAEHDVDDLKQMGRMECLSLLAKGKYDPSRPLGAYLFVHVKRRYQNLRRRHFRADDVGCKDCYRQWLAGSRAGCGKGTPGCARFTRWADFQEARYRRARTRSIEAADFEDAALTQQDKAAEDLAHSEMHAIIDAKLPVALRGDYLMMLAGEPVQTQRRAAVRAAVLEILTEAGHEIEVRNCGSSEAAVYVAGAEDDTSSGPDHEGQADEHEQDREDD